jgi:hypothetical protein
MPIQICARTAGIPMSSTKTSTVAKSSAEMYVCQKWDGLLQGHADAKTLNRRFPMRAELLNLWRNRNMLLRPLNDYEREMRFLFWARVVDWILIGLFVLTCVLTVPDALRWVWKEIKQEFPVVHAQTVTMQSPTSAAESIVTCASDAENTTGEWWKVKDCPAVDGPTLTNIVNYFGREIDSYEHCGGYGPWIINGDGSIMGRYPNPPCTRRAKP